MKGPKTHRRLLTADGKRREYPHPLARRVTDSQLANLNRKGRPVRTELTASQLQYLEWLTTPKDERSPKTQEEEAAVLGVSPMTLYRWRTKDEKFRAEWDKRLEEKHLSPLTQQTLMDRLLKIAEYGSDRDAIAAIGLYQKVIGQMAPDKIVLTGADAAKQLPEEELRRAVEAGVIPLRREA